jgi:hypothetical protein
MGPLAPVRRGGAHALSRVEHVGIGGLRQDLRERDRLPVRRIISCAAACAARRTSASLSRPASARALLRAPRVAERWPRTPPAGLPYPTGRAHIHNLVLIWREQPLTLGERGQGREHPLTSVEGGHSFP